MPMAYINFVEGGVDPGYGRPGGGGGGGPAIDNTLPIPNPAPGRPGNLPSVPPGWPVIPAHPIAGVPGGPRPDNTLPNPPPDRPGHLPSVPEGWPIIPARPWPPLRPDRPDQGLPHPPHFPDQGLPDHPPPLVPEGHTLILVKTADGKWHWAALEPGQPVPTPLPEPTPEPK